ncbi:hypothetical protein COV18_07255 [Candidatus Woesearchaeota archaeon CG10_big_fil_rev_8_21_14_0_10_37_12]|nr:MAG: hypothetical protein COV18_07255 [Candidatus Woesearchaeota archaeon CG10_big_fil_rev_8_21_14_0_10_37_12]
MKKSVVILLFVFLLIACAPQFPEPVVEEKIIKETIVQCWDGSLVAEISLCPEKEEVDRVPVKSLVVEEEPALPIVDQLLQDAKERFDGLAYSVDGRLVIIYGTNARHMFDIPVRLDDSVWITDVFVDLANKTAVAYCNIEREGRFIDSFEYQRSKCKEFINIPINASFAKWYPRSPIAVLEEFVVSEPILVEDNQQVVNLGGKTKTVRPSIHYLVNGKRVVLRIDARYKVPIAVDYENNKDLVFDEVFFDTMRVDGKQQRITKEWVVYTPVADYWNK